MRARTVTVGPNAAGSTSSQWVRFDEWAPGSTVTVQVDVSGTVNYTVQTTLDDPAGAPPNVTATAQNLLAINDFGKAAGFWTDKDGHLHGFVVQLNTQTPAASTFTSRSC